MWPRPQALQCCTLRSVALCLCIVISVNITLIINLGVWHNIMICIIKSGYDYIYATQLLTSYMQMLVWVYTLAPIQYTTVNSLAYKDNCYTNIWWHLYSVNMHCFDWYTLFSLSAMYNVMYVVGTLFSLSATMSCSTLEVRFINFIRCNNVLELLVVDNTIFNYHAWPHSKVNGL